MLDLDSFYRPSSGSWADMMDEDEEGLYSGVDDDDDDDDGNAAAAAKTKPKPTTTTDTKGEKKPTVGVVASAEDKEPPPKPEPKLKESKDGGIVWRIPSAKQREEQKAVMQMLVEQRRRNLDNLDSWRRKDDNNDSKVSASDLATSWRRPVHKYDRIPVHPKENNSVQGWAAYSQTLQKEYEQECETAKQEFIKRFGSSSTKKEEEIPKPAPLEILITADGPSDWADDIPLNGDENNEEEEEEEESEHSIVEEELAKEMDTKIALNDVCGIKDNHTTMQQSDNVTHQGQEGEQDTRDVAIVVTNATEEKLDHRSGVVDNVGPEEGAMRWDDYAAPSNNTSSSSGTPNNNNSAEATHKLSDLPPQPEQEASSQWRVFVQQAPRSPSPSEVGIYSSPSTDHPPEPRQPVDDAPCAQKWIAFAQQASPGPSNVAVHSSPSADHPPESRQPVDDASCAQKWIAFAQQASPATFEGPVHSSPAVDHHPNPRQPVSDTALPLEESPRSHGPSRSPGDQTTTASSSTSTVESKSYDTLRYSSDDNSSTRILSHSTSTSTETSDDIHHHQQKQKQHKSPAPPPRVRSALSQITSHLLKNASRKDLSSNGVHATAAPLEQQQHHHQIRDPNNNNSREDHMSSSRNPVSPLAREAPIHIAQPPPMDHHQSTGSNGLSPSSTQSHANRLSVSPTIRNGGWQPPSPRTRHQGRHHPSSSPSREAQGGADMGWQSFAREHTSRFSQPHHQG